MTKILRAAGATFAYNMRGTSRRHAKFTGDLGNAIEVIRISDRSLLSVFAKNLEPCNFRLLQHNPPRSGHCSDRPLCARSGPSIIVHSPYCALGNWPVQIRSLLNEITLFPKH